MPASATGAADRFGVTLLFSLMAHAVVALGITFQYEKAAPRLPSLDVILVQSANAEKPEKADFLAQANNAGGGNSDEVRRPGRTLSSPSPQPADGIAPIPTETGAPAPSTPRHAELLTQRQSDFSVTTDTEAPDQPQYVAPTEREMLERKLEMARLAQEIQREAEQYAKRPKRKFISANTREHEYAAYMSAWVARVERIATLNYPVEARQRQLQGQLVLTVGLRRDGSVASVDVIQPSGHKALDDAAIRSVHLAAPFAALPTTDEKVDELYVTRTWQFLPGNVVQTR